MVCAQRPMLEKKSRGQSRETSTTTHIVAHTHKRIALVSGELHSCAHLSLMTARISGDESGMSGERIESITNPDIAGCRGFPVLYIPLYQILPLCYPRRGQLDSRLIRRTRTTSWSAVNRDDQTSTLTYRICEGAGSRFLDQRYRTLVSELKRHTKQAADR